VNALVKRQVTLSTSLHGGGGVSGDRAQVLVGACLCEDDRERGRLAGLEHRDQRYRPIQESTVLIAGLIIIVATLASVIR
jgi:hypothetical protein